MTATTAQTTYDVYVDGRKDKSFDDNLAAQRRMDVIDRACRKGKRVAMVVIRGRTREIHFKQGKNLTGSVLIEIQKTEDNSFDRFTISEEEASKSAYESGGNIFPGDPMYDFLMGVMKTGRPAFLTIEEERS